MGGAVPSLCRGASCPVSLPGVLGAPGDAGWAWHGTPLLSAWVLGAGHGCYLRACSRWPPRRRCRGGGHPVRSPWGSRRTGRVGWSMLWGSNPDARDGAPPFEGGASTCSAKHRGSPCLLVEGADCAGVCLAVLAWLCPGLVCRCWVLLCQAVSRRTALCSYAPALTGRGCGVASGATKLVPAFLSGLAQCREQCPSLIGKPCTSFTIRGGRLRRLRLRPAPRMTRCVPP